MIKPKIMSKILDNKNFIKFLINHKERYFPINQGQLIAPDLYLIPEKLKYQCRQYEEYGFKGSIAHDFTKPYLDVRAFDLFMNLILTSKHIKIFNPYNLAEEDLEPVFLEFAYYAGSSGHGNDDNCVGKLKSRLRD